MNKKATERINVSKSGKRKNSNNKIIIASSVTAGIILITVIILLVIKPSYKKPDDNDSLVMTEDNVNEIKDKVDSTVAEGYFETYMTTNWTFPNGKSSASDAVFGNSENNHKPIYCDIVLNSTGEKIYQSGVIPVGQTLSDIKLDTTLKAGTYAAVCNVHLLNDDGNGKYSEYSSAGFDLTLNILK